jgi:hypothetical protein
MYNHVLHLFMGIFIDLPYLGYNCVMAVLTGQLRTPRGRYDEHSGKFSLSMKPRFNRPVGERSHF